MYTRLKETLQKIYRRKPAAIVLLVSGRRQPVFQEGVQFHVLSQVHHRDHAVYTYLSNFYSIINSIPHSEVLPRKVGDTSRNVIPRDSAAIF